MKQIIAKTDPTIDIKITAQNIEYESYWKKACLTRWTDPKKSIYLEKHGLSWKVAFLEKYIEEYLQNLLPIED